VFITVAGFPGEGHMSVISGPQPLPLGHYSQQRGFGDTCSPLL